MTMFIMAILAGLFVMLLGSTIMEVIETFIAFEDEEERMQVQQVVYKMAAVIIIVIQVMNFGGSMMFFDSLFH